MQANTLNASIIITTYNRPDALALVLQALAHQDTTNFEVIIADDGSTSTTKELITHLQTTMPYKLYHIWQSDLGFRAAKIRNQAVAHARSDYLIFMDGDCVPNRSFVRRHLQLREKNWFVVGNRILLTKAFTQQVINSNLAIYQWHIWQWLNARIHGNCNRILPILYLPMTALRKKRAHVWQGAKTCNLALWKKDFLAINGFEETYEGWGYEDSDLVIRLLRNHIQRKDGHYAVPVFHLWHPENDRSQEQDNLKRLQTIQNSTAIKASLGISQYL